MTANEAWREALVNLLVSGRPVNPRGQATTEILNYSSKVDMQFPIVTVPERKLSYQFMAAEAAWIMAGDDRVSSIAPFAPSIAKFSDNGETFFGAYGPRVVNQSEYLARTLANDKDTRQAVITIWRQNPPETKDVPCTVAVQWLIRDGFLHCIDTMRSSDVWLGWPYDVFNFSMLSISVLLHLRFCYGIEYQLGSLWLNAGSQHLYLRNADKAQQCVRSQPMSSTPFFRWQFRDPCDLEDYLVRVSRNEESF